MVYGTVQGIETDDRTVCVIGYSIKNTKLVAAPCPSLVDISSRIRKLCSVNNPESINSWIFSIFIVICLARRLVLRSNTG